MSVYSELTHDQQMEMAIMASMEQVQVEEQRAACLSLQESKPEDWVIPSTSKTLAAFGVVQFWNQDPCSAVLRTTSNLLRDVDETVTAVILDRRVGYWPSVW